MHDYRIKIFWDILISMVRLSSWEKTYIEKNETYNNNMISIQNIFLSSWWEENEKQQLQQLIINDNKKRQRTRTTRQQVATISILF